MSYDAVVLPELEKVLGNAVERKAVFIHLMGSHLTYALRYPPEFRRVFFHGRYPHKTVEAGKRKTVCQYVR